MQVGVSWSRLHRAHGWLAPGQREVVHRDLAQTRLPFVTAPWHQAYFTPPGQQSSDMKEELRLSDELVTELLAADHIVISTPVYNYNVPASPESMGRSHRPQRVDARS